MSDDKKRDDLVIEMGDRKGAFDTPMRSPAPPQTPGQAPPLSAVTNNPIFPILSYCGSSILMTVTNKYVLSGLGFNLNFFLLCVQVCWATVSPKSPKAYPLIVCGMCGCHSDMQKYQHNHVPGLQLGRSQEMCVSDIFASLIHTADRNL